MSQQKGNSLVVTLILSLVVVVIALVYFYLQNQKLINPKTPFTPSATNPDLSCQQDSDCSLQIKDSWSNCNLGQSCQPVDYSEDQWIGVNNNWYQQTRDNNCPQSKYPPRGCDPKPVNDQYVAKCVQNTCVKKSIPSVSY